MKMWNLSNRLIVAVFFGLFVTSLYFYIGRPIFDADFWWHLKTGDEMRRVGGLLSADPFNFTGDQSQVSLRERYILHGYWLWQVVASKLYELFSVPGIWLLNGLALVLLWGGVAVRMRKQGVAIEVAIPLVVAGHIVFANLYFLERPQIFSFVFLSILLGLFEDVWRGGRGSLWLYPIMALWANVHGGVAFGVISLLLFCFGVAWDERHNRQRCNHLLVWAGCGVLASCLSPNLWYGYFGLIDPKLFRMFEFIKEYRSIFQIFSTNMFVVIVLFGIIIVHCCAIVFSKRKVIAAEILLTAFFIYEAIKHERSIGFFAVSMAPVTAIHVSEMVKKFKYAKVFTIVASYLMILLLSYDVYISSGKYNAKLADNKFIADYFPNDIGTFLSKNNVSGNIFNGYEWGGYLVWRLYPHARLFIDGRGINEKVFFDYMKIINASQNQIGDVQEYKYLLDRYCINYIVINNHIDGMLYPVMKYVLNDKMWVPVYIDRLGYIFARNSQENYDLINRYKIDKIVFLNTLMSYFDAAISSKQNNYMFYLGRGELFAYIGKYEEARRDFLMVRAAQPNNKNLPMKEKQLELLQRQTQR